MPGTHSGCPTTELLWQLVAGFEEHHDDENNNYSFDNDDCDNKKDNILNMCASIVI